jgi:hypothetical protein
MWLCDFLPKRVPDARILIYDQEARLAGSEDDDPLPWMPAHREPLRTTGERRQSPWSPPFGPADDDPPSFTP